MKKILSILMALVLMLSMLTLISGCGNKGSKKLVGVWEAVWLEADGEDYENFENHYMAFTADGKCLIAYDGIGTNVLVYEYEIDGDELVVEMGENGSAERTVEVDGDSMTMTSSVDGMEVVYGFERIEAPDESEIIGKWECERYDSVKKVTFNKNGTFKYRYDGKNASYSGDWSYADGVITMEHDGETEYWLIRIDDDMMYIKFAWDGSLSEEYERQ
ncbi:MAG: hypothetical protein IKL62_06670 [Clostridia bacterium]|nr:hypothetical protein [Clostridia bacterium]